jgi:hypothetical protein
MKKFMSLMCLFFVFGLTLSAQKMKAEEVAAKNLDSIGTADTRGKIKNSVVRGSVVFSLGLTKNSVLNGNSLFASEGGKRLFGLLFSSDYYPMERIGYDENKLKIASGNNSTYSALGSYLQRFPEVIKEGLFGGATQTNWAMENYINTKAKLEFGGKKKLDGKEVFTLNYSPKKGTGLNIKLFFDATTFQHLRTEYRNTISSQLGPTPETSSSQTETQESLIEDFSDFKVENGLNLPHSYNIKLASSGRTTKEWIYKFTFDSFLVNQPIDAKSFDIDAK